MFSSKLLEDHLKTKSLGRIIKYNDKTKSTNIDAKEFINDKNYHGSVFITDSQLKGRGRRNNIWESSPNKSLTFSLLLYPEIEFKSIGLLPLLAGVSVVEGIRASTSIQTRLKWPNDIILNHKKIGGILIETKQTRNGLGIIIGIGLNINEKILDIPNYIIEKTTSLTIFTERYFSREKILATILNEFENLLENSLNSIISIWEKSCIHMNSDVSFHSEEGLHKGIFKGISSHGYALIDINGTIRTFPSGIIIL